MSVSDVWTRLAPKPRALQAGQKHHVFLSYRSVNRKWVLNLYDVLRTCGFQVFLDQVSLVGGDQLIKVLEEGLAKSQAGVLVWSSEAADSEWVMREYQTLERRALAPKSQFQFVPLCLDDAPLPDFAANRVFIDFRSYPDGPNGGDLLRLLHAVVGQPLSEEAARFAAEQDELAQQEAHKVGAAIKNSDLDELNALLRQGGLAWETSSALGCKAAEGLVKLTEVDAAIAACEALERQFPKAIRPRQLRALALARRGKEGDLKQAQRIVGALYESGERDPETVGIYARTWMDRHALSNDPSDLAQSRDLYVEAFDGAADDYYTGVNAAAKSVFLGTPEDLDRARGYAERVQQIVGTEPHAGDYWKSATVAELHLIAKSYSEAARVYKAAIAMARAEKGSHQSTYLQATRLMKHLQPSAEERQLIREVFKAYPEPVV